MLQLIYASLLIIISTGFILLEFVMATCFILNAVKSFQKDLNAFSGIQPKKKITIGEKQKKQLEIEEKIKKLMELG